MSRDIVSVPTLASFPGLSPRLLLLADKPGNETMPTSLVVG